MLEKVDFANMGISEMESIVKKGTKEFNLKNILIEGFTENGIFMEYKLLQLSSMKNAPKHFVKDYFEGIEGQASWIVLRESFSDKEISNYENQERQSLFVEKLYEHSDKFVFFEERKKALENLNSLGIINQEDYKPMLQEQ